MAKESKIITNLKSVRESMGMTQQELADRIGMRRETILHLEITVTILRWNGSQNCSSLQSESRRPL